MNDLTLNLTPPPVTDSGELFVNVVAAYNLINNDLIGGHSDPFARVI